MARELDSKLLARLRTHRRVKEEGTGAPDEERVEVNVTYTGPLADLEAAGLRVSDAFAGIATGTIRVADLERLAAVDGVHAVREPQKGQPLLDQSVPAIRVPPVWNGSTPYKGQGVVLGIVDTGIDIFHHAFRLANGDTRILKIWDQTLRASDLPSTLPSGWTAHPSGVGYVFDRQAIDAALDAPPNATPAFPHVDTDGHGTHVAGITGGDGSQAGTTGSGCKLAETYIGVAPEAELIIVKTTFSDMNTAQGARWIFEQAAPRPAVVNVSIGGHDGPHDGTEQDEVYLDETLMDTSVTPPQPRPGRVLVIAAGNDADKKMHAKKHVPANGSASVRFDVFPGDRFRLSVLAIYGAPSHPPSGRPAGTAAGARLDVTLNAPPASPGTHAQTVAAPSGTSTWNDPTPLPIANAPITGNARPSMVDFVSSLDVRYGIPNDAGRHEVRFLLSPGSQAALAPGEWRIDFNETAGFDTDVHVYLIRHRRLELEQTISANGTLDVTFNVRRAHYALDEAYIGYSGTGRIAVVIQAPCGVPPSAEVAPPAAIGVNQQTLTVGEHTVVVRSELTSGTHSIRISIRSTGTSVAQGAWVIKLAEKAGTDTEIYSRLHEDRDSARGHDGKAVWAQPAFVSADDEPSATITSPGTARNAICVGAYDIATGGVTDFSSRGPLIDGRPRPHVAAPGVAISAPKARARSTPGMSDCCVQFYVDDQGTSMAAPHVAGVVALMLNKQPTLTFEQARDAIVAKTRAGTANPNVLGFGIVDAQNIFASTVPVPAFPPGTGPTITSAEPDPEEHVPFGAVWDRFLPTAARLKELQAALLSNDAGRVLLALVSRHFDEVFRIVNTVGQAAARWHRMGGPWLLRRVVGWSGDPAHAIVPTHVRDHSVVEGLPKLLRTLQRHGSSRLAEDIAAWQSFVLSLPGAPLADLVPTKADTRA